MTDPPTPGLQKTDPGGIQARADGGQVEVVLRGGSGENLDLGLKTL